MRRPKLSKKLMKVIICVLIIVVVVIAVFYGSWIDFKTYYLGVMKELNSFETKAYMCYKINGTYNFIELLNWTNQNLNWSKESFTRYSNPKQILNQGKGRCEEFTIVYVAACLALGYEARIVVSRQFYLIFVRGFHTWAEVKVNGVWIHVDPSPTAFWNDTSRYRNLRLGSKNTLKVFILKTVRLRCYLTILCHSHIKWRASFVNLFCFREINRI